MCHLTCIRIPTSCCDSHDNNQQMSQDSYDGFVKGVASTVKNMCTIVNNIIQGKGIQPKWNPYIPIYILNIQLFFKPLQYSIHNGMSLSTTTCWLSLWFQMHHNFEVFSIMVTFIIMPLDIGMYLISITFNPMMWPWIRNFYCNFLSIWENPIIYMAISSFAEEVFEITCGLYHLC